MKESVFQAKLIREIKKRFPGAIVLKNDPNYIQGFPDLTVLYKDRWAVLEIKQSEKASHQPNQDFYILQADKMSVGRFVYPENMMEVLDDLARSFQVSR
jgi:hypothetical protein|nr:MAG TPA: hydrolase [Caudoviricetes sp.]